MEFERDTPTTGKSPPGPRAGAAGTDRDHHHLQARPDPEMFGDLTFDYEILADRFREIAYLCKGLAIILVDERTGRSDTFRFEGGIAEYVVWLNEPERNAGTRRRSTSRRKSSTIRPRTWARDSRSRSRLRSSTRRRGQKVRCYTNNAYNPAGGTHLSGFRAGLTRASTPTGRRKGIQAGSRSPRRRLPLRADGCGEHRPPRPGVRVADQDQAEQPRSGRDRQQRGLRVPLRISGEEPEGSASDCKRIALAAELAAGRQEGPRRDQ